MRRKRTFEALVCGRPIRNTEKYKDILRKTTKTERKTRKERLRNERTFEALVFGRPIRNTDKYEEILRHTKRYPEILRKKFKKKN